MYPVSSECVMGTHQRTNAWDKLHLECEACRRCPRLHTGPCLQPAVSAAVAALEARQQEAPLAAARDALLADVRGDGQPVTVRHGFLHVWRWKRIAGCVKHHTVGRDEYRHSTCTGVGHNVLVVTEVRFTAPIHTTPHAYGKYQPQVGQPLAVDLELYERLLAGRAAAWEAGDPGSGLLEGAPLPDQHRGQFKIGPGAARVAEMADQLLQQATTAGVCMSLLGLALPHAAFQAH